MAPLLDPAFLRKLDRLTLITRRAMPGDMQGERRSPRRGSSVEFADFRPYTIGDDIRQIDWNLYARLGKFFLKLFVAEEELTVHLLVDSSRSMDWGDPNKLQYARQLAGALGYIVVSSIDRVKLTAFGAAAQPMPAVRGKRGAFMLFQFLQNLSAEQAGATSFAVACQRYAQATRQPGPLILCSDLLDPDWQEGLRVLLSRSFEITLLHILAPQELNPQIDGDFRLIDSESGVPVEITADMDMLRRYRDHLDGWRSEVEAFCSGHRITYLFVDTGVPLEEFVLSSLRNRMVVH
jgi:uncharacterized protein (DUF58 family)